MNTVSKQFVTAEPLNPQDEILPLEKGHTISLEEIKGVPNTWDLSSETLSQIGRKGVESIRSCLSPQAMRDERLAQPLQHGLELELTVVEAASGLPAAKLGNELKDALSDSPIGSYLTYEFQSHVIEVAFPKNCTVDEAFAILSTLLDKAQTLNSRLIGEGTSFTPQHLLTSDAITPNGRYFTLAHELEVENRKWPNTFSTQIENASSNQFVQIDCEADSFEPATRTLRIQSSLGSFVMQNMNIGYEGLMTSAQGHIEPRDQGRYMEYHRAAEICNSYLLGLFAGSPLIDFEPTGVLEVRPAIWAASTHKYRAGNLQLSASGKPVAEEELTYLRYPTEQFDIAQANILMPPSAAAAKDIGKGTGDAAIALAAAKAIWPHIRTTFGAVSDTEGRLRIELRDFPTPATLTDALINQRICEALIFACVEDMNAIVPLGESAEELAAVHPFADVIRDRRRAFAFGLDAQVSAASLGLGTVELGSLWRDALFEKVKMGLALIEANENESALVLDALHRRLHFDRSRLSFQGQAMQGHGVTDAEIKLHMWQQLRDTGLTKEEQIVVYNTFHADCFERSIRLQRSSRVAATDFLSQFENYWDSHLKKSIS